MQFNSKKNYKTDMLSRMQVVHLGKILFNLEFLVLIIMLSSVISILIPVVFYLFMLLISLVTFFSIYIIYPEFASWWGSGTVMLNISEMLNQSWKYTVPILIVISILAIICLSNDKSKSNKGKIICSIIMASIALLIFIFRVLMGV